MTTMLRFMALTLVLPLLSLAAEPLGETDRNAIRSVIQAQLDAFRADDAERAFSYASPGIQIRFGNPMTFMAMVVGSYQAVHRPRVIEFRELIELPDDRIAQQVFLVGPRGQAMIATYAMEQQPDGLWRIDGCFLVPVSEQLL